MVFAVRIVRAGVGMLLLLLAVPLMIAGGGLWLVGDHRASDGTFSASVERLRINGRAIVIADVDGLLRADAPFARGGRTTLSVSARGPGGPLFLGLGQYSDVEHYLAGVAQARVTRVRIARGPLPIDATSLPGELTPKDVPAAQPFWLATSTGLIRDGRPEDALTWSPSSVRGRHLALVVMNADASAGVDVSLLARLKPAWLGPTAGGLLILGTALALLAVLVLAWPSTRRRETPAGAVPAPPADPADLESPLDLEPPLDLETPAGPERPTLPPLPPITLRFMWPPPAKDGAPKIQSEASSPAKVDA